MSKQEQFEPFRYVKAARRLFLGVIEYLENLSETAASEEVRLEAVLALGMIGDNHSLSAISNAFKHNPDSIEPITALGYFKSGASVRALLDRLKDPEAPYKEEIVRVLGIIGDPMAAKTLQQLLHDEDRMVRYYAARALYGMGGQDVVQSLCALINDPDEWIVINVLEILAQIKDPDAIPVLVGYFEVAADSRLKAIIISSLASFNENRLLKTFESGLNSYDARIQANSVEAIAKLKIPAPEMKRLLKRLYGHQNSRVRANVCIALANADKKAVLNELNEMISSSSPSSRRSAAYVLARIDVENRKELIHRLLADENAGVRKMALKAALTLKDKLRAAEILPMLADSNEWVRKEAVECAVEVDTFPDGEVLEMLKKEKCPAVIESVLKFALARHLTCASADIYERTRRESEEELPWLIAALGQLGAKDELLKVNKSAGALRSDVLAEYYQAMLLNGNFSVFNDILRALKDKKREIELLPIIKAAGTAGAFLRRENAYSDAMKEALTSEVLKDLEGVRKLEETPPEINYAIKTNEGIEAFNAGDYTKARELLIDVISSCPDNINARYYLAQTYYNTGDTDKAVHFLSEIIDDDPSHIGAAVILGQIYFRKKAWKRLSSCCERVVKYVDDDDKKNTIRIFGALGLAYFNQKQYQKAIMALSRGLRANPRDLSSSYHLALCYYAVDESERARAILEGLKKTLPADSQILKNVIELLQRI